MTKKYGPGALHWIGRSAGGMVAAAMLADASVQLFAPDLAAAMLREAGFAPDIAPALGAIMLACTVLYAIPATALLGAILVTGFLGGAICAHVRLGEVGSPPEIISLLSGLLTWGGLCLRERRLFQLLPIRPKADRPGIHPPGHIQTIQTLNIRTSK